MNLPAISVSRKIAVSMVICIMILFGTISFFDLGLDLLPELEYPFISVITTYEGVGTSEIELHITRPIEEAVAMVKNVSTVYSISQEGSSTLIVKFDWGTNLGVAVQDIRDKLSYLSDVLPREADDPKVLKYNTEDMPVIFYAVTGLENTRALRDYIRDNVEASLNRLEGVAAVYPMGGLEREINVFIDRAKLHSFGLSFEQIRQVIALENLNLSGGHITEHGVEYLVRTLGEFDRVEEIGEIAIAAPDGKPVYLKDVATVSDTFKEVRSISRVNGKDCVLVGILREAGANTVAVVDRVKEKLEEVKKRIPQDIVFEPMMDQAQFIKSAIVATAMNLLEGGVLAILMLFVFLRSVRPTVIISLAIPLSIIATFIGMKATNYTFNIMTLSGLGLGIGMLVDNAIVVIENTFRRLEGGESPREAAKFGASEVSSAITASTLTTVAVFVPIALAKGVAGQLAKPLGFTVCIALFASLFVAITIVPMLSSLILKRENFKGKKGDKGRFKFRDFIEKYKGMLAWSLRHRVLVLVSSAIAFVLSLSAIALVGAEFMPKMDNPMALFMLRMSPGTPLDRTGAAVSKIEEVMHKQTEVETVGSFIGLSESTKYDVAAGWGAADVNEAEIMVTLLPKAERTKVADEVVEAIRDQAPKIPDAEFEHLDMGDLMTGSQGGEKPIEIKVFGKDIDRLKEIVAFIRDECEDVQGLRDLKSTFQEGKPEIQLEIDRRKASQLGLTVYQVAQSVKDAMLGVIASNYRVGGDEFDIRLRLKELDRVSEDDMLQIPISSPLGFAVPLSQIAKIRRMTGPIKIEREDKERKITLQASTFERDVGSIVSEIKTRLASLRLPSGYYIEFGGSYQQMVDAFEVLLAALVIAVLLIFMVMAAQFESLVQPFIVMFTIPLGIVGVVVGLLVTNTTLSVPTIMGTIILLGIVVNDAIVMIDYINQLRRRGEDPRDAVIDGAGARLRPILITTMTTVLGILPLSFSTSEGAELRAPMGIAIGFGLTFATLLTLFVIPAIYTAIGRISFKEGKYGNRHAEKAD
ncbi:MAG: efflux RND transporter permease subunit [Candidatus Coatesbacteria bacterium]|nr:efflux RND transporter permease subunit [Candidatus Coatesbacteria bacterium]